MSILCCSERAAGVPTWLCLSPERQSSGARQMRLAEVSEGPDANGMSPRYQPKSGPTEHNCEVVALRKAAHRCYRVVRGRSHIACTKLDGANPMESLEEV